MDKFLLFLLMFGTYVYIPFLIPPQALVLLLYHILVIVLAS